MSYISCGVFVGLQSTLTQVSRWAYRGDGSGDGGDDVKDGNDVNGANCDGACANDVIDRAAGSTPSTVRASRAGTRIGGKKKRMDFDIAASPIIYKSQLDFLSPRTGLNKNRLEPKWIRGLC